MKKQNHNIEFFKKVLEEVFLEYKKKLRINKDWKVNVQLRKNKGLFAEVVYDYAKREFTIYVNETMHGTIRSLEDTVIHEFWHILLTPYTAKMENTLDEGGKARIQRVGRRRKAFKSEEESLVRKFTRIIVDMERQRKELEKEIRILKKRSKNNGS